MKDSGQLLSGGRRSVVIAFSIAVLMIGQQVAGKALRDAYFLGNFEATALPRVMMVASVLSVLSVLGVSRLYRRTGPSRVAPLIFAASGLAFVIEWLLSATSPRAAATLLYLHTSSGTVAISGFWLLLSELFDPHQAKQSIGRVASGATLGGVVGGLAAWQAAPRLSIPTMLLVLAVANFLCGFGLGFIGRKGSAGAAEQHESAATEIFRKTPYLRNLFALVAVLALAAAAYEYVFKATAAEYFADSDKLIGFFALYYLVLGLATFFLQTALVSRVVRWIGIAPSIGIYPATVTVLSGLTLFFPGIVLATVLRSGAAVIENSIYRSAYEVLYTPLAPSKKRPTKSLIDVGGDKLGGAFGAAIAVFVVGLIPSHAESVLLVLASLFGIVGVFLSSRLLGGYIQQLRENLRSGSLDPASLQIQDTDTEAAVRQTMILGPGVSDFSSGGEFEHPNAQVADRRPAYFRRKPIEGDRERDAALEHLAFGGSDDVARVLRRFHPLPPEWTSIALMRLNDPEVRDLVYDALRVVAPAHIGLFEDAVYDRRLPMSIRWEIPGLIGTVPTERALRALVFMLEIDEQGLRYRVALAIREVGDRLPTSKLPIEQLRKGATNELERGLTYLRPEPHLTTTVALAFTIEVLALMLPRNALEQALDALCDKGGRRRGTALEYLETVLPTELRVALAPYIEHPGHVQAALESSTSLIKRLNTGGGAPRTIAELRSRLRATY
ncbi:MAG: hypothetical protein AAF735_04795 [Myxococcota bacterium]